MKAIKAIRYWWYRVKGRLFPKRVLSIKVISADTIQLGGSLRQDVTVDGNVECSGSFTGFPPHWLSTSGDFTAIGPQRVKTGISLKLIREKK